MQKSFSEFRKELNEELTTGDFSDIISKSPYRNSGFSDSSVIRRNYKIFDVDTSTYLKARTAKKYFKNYDDYFSDPEIKNYAKKNPTHPIIIRHPQSGEMVFFRNGSQTLNSLRNFKQIYK